jgi:hypothetical protein
MIDILVDNIKNDLVIIGGVVQMVSGTDQIKQAIRLKLLTFSGEWFLDLSYGVPWYTRVLGKRFSAGQIQMTVSDAISTIPGVKSIVDIVAVKQGERSALVTVQVLTNVGDKVSVTTEVP